MTGIRQHFLSDVDLDAKEATCVICGRVSVKVRPNGRMECITPTRAHARAWAQKRDGRDARRRSTLAAYGLTPDSYAEMVDAQGGVCAVCAVPPQPGKNLHIDHDHATGAVRGLLCSPCNVALGFMRDDPGRLEAAAEYLKRSIQTAS